MNNKVEIIANSILSVIGIAGGIASYLGGYMGLSCVMFSIALACIMYQFLGGISQEHSFQLGVIKLGGTAAVLVMFMYFLNNYILKDEFRITPESGWMPIDTLTGKMINIAIVYKGDTIEIPGKGKIEKYMQSRSKQTFKLVESDSTAAFGLKTTLADEYIGYVDTRNDWPKTLFRKLSPNNESEIIRFYLTPDLNTGNVSKSEAIKKYLPGFEWASSSKQINSTPKSLPFEIKVLGSQFSIIKDDKEIISGDIVSRKCYVVPHQHEAGGYCSYIVFLEQANYDSNNSFGVRYSKWLVKLVYHVL